ncbi:MAG: hypothetical protein ACFE9J_08660 [Candidatus Hermodarchaeota archaeon]
MSKFSKVVLSAFTLMIVMSLISAVNVNAIGESDQIIEVNGDSIQTQLQSNLKTTFQFREMTKLTICTNVNLNLDINCEALKIAEKDFMLELEGDKNLKMTMTCTREEIQLGLMDGNIYRIRNRNVYKYQEGFCVTLECVCGCLCQNECQCECDCECKCLNECQCVCDCECQCLNECQCLCDCECLCQNECHCVCNCEDKTCFIQARLRIRVTNQNRLGNWAYYDESEEWVTVPTTIEDGYLTTTTNHFSTWTILIPTSQSNTALIIGSSVTIAFIGIIMSISVISIKKRK